MSKRQERLKLREMLSKIQPKTLRNLGRAYDIEGSTSMSKEEALSKGMRNELLEAEKQAGTSAISSVKASLPELLEKLASEIEYESTRKPLVNVEPYTGDPSSMEDIVETMKKRLAAVEGIDIKTGKPLSKSQKELFTERGKNAADMKTGGLSSQLKTLLNKIQNKTRTDTPTKGKLGGVSGLTMGAITDLLGDMEIADKSAKGSRAVTNISKQLNKKIFGDTEEERIIEFLKKEFPTLDVQKELSDLQVGKGSDLASFTGRTASGRRWRVMEDGSINII